MLRDLDFRKSLYSQEHCWQVAVVAESTVIVMELPFLMAVFRYVYIFPEWKNKKVHILVTLLMCAVNMLNINLTRRAFKMKFCGVS